MSLSLSIQETTNQNSEKVVFVVDDDEHIGLLITQLIQQETPHKAWHHTTGGKALEALSLHTPHLFILDYELPDMNGLELHDQLHKFDSLRDVPTLLISAMKPPLRELRKRTITFLAKPLDLTELLHTISRLLT